MVGGGAGLQILAILAPESPPSPPPSYCLIKWEQIVKNNPLALMVLFSFRSTVHVRALFDLHNDPKGRYY